MVCVSEAYAEQSVFKNEAGYGKSTPWQHISFNHSVQVTNKVKNVGNLYAQLR